MMLHPERNSSKNRINGVLFSSNHEGNHAIYDNTHKPGTERLLPYDLTYESYKKKVLKKKKLIEAQ